MQKALTRRHVAVLFIAGTLTLIATPGLADNVEALLQKQAELSVRAGNLAGKMIGPFNSKSSMEPWTRGAGYEALADLTKSAERLASAMLETEPLRKNGERLRQLNANLTKNVRAIPALDGSSKLPAVLEEIHELLRRIEGLSR